MKWCYVLIFALLCSLTVSAQSKRKRKKRSKRKTEIRMERKNVVSAELGIKTLSGWGLNYTRHINSRIALDAGLGIGILRTRIGVQGRYHFSDKNFAPCVYAGITSFPKAINNVEVTDGNTNTIANMDYNSSFHGRFGAGFDWISRGGFNVRLLLGYQLALNKVSSAEITFGEDTPENVQSYEDAAKLIFGQGISFGLNLGYAF